MDLRARRLTGWWKTSTPDAAASTETETGTVVRLRADTARSELIVETTLSDEKGEVTYRQVFSRQ